ncbi:MAG: tRNA lysidine(34) synthetase TilS [Pyrinomonadaceae bacterium]|nr:tRNA lysidine(34) synthetase TilS [Pyrinomonadaceae bacterium]
MSDAAPRANQRASEPNEELPFDPTLTPPGERVLAAVSGGADSMALLLALDELSGRGRLALAVTVAHLDHGLRAEAGASDARWVAEQSSALGCEVVLGSAAVKVRATEARDNLEQAARRARYEFLAAVAMERKACVVLAAHTLDDQAETVLLRLLRGSGAEGLSGIEPLRMLFEKNGMLLARPLLGWARRADTEAYCLERGVVPRVDAMNRDERYARVRVRRNLLPLMQTFNGRIVEALARTAQLLREDSAALELAAAELLGQASAQHPDKKSAQQPQMLAPLRVDVLRGAPPALRRRALRQWIAMGRGDLRRLEMVHLLAVENLLEGERGGRRIELPGGASIKRKRGLLYFDLKRVEKGDAAV